MTVKLTSNKAAAVTDDLAFIVRNAIAYIKVLEAELARCKQVCAATSEAWREEAALAEPVEPVAWRFKAMIGMPWSLSDDGYYISCKRDQRYFVEALYTSPPQRKPLDDLAIADIYTKWDATPGTSMADFARAIERAHGIGGQP